METWGSLMMLQVVKKRSYRTYEEWKLTRPTLALVGEAVLTVPMRNGNLMTSKSFRLSKTKFLPYLWGMETSNIITPRYSNAMCSYRTYEEWKRSKSKYTSTSKLSVLTVPMRNGNFPRQSHCEQVLNWVLTVPMRNGNIDMEVHTESSNHGSYRTYEEWKQEVFGGLWNGVKVLTVPMRNGNPKPSGCFGPLNFVLTVPMRNGNLAIARR